MTPLQGVAGDWLADGRPAMLVEVSASRGSVPREAGTRMLVSASHTAGTIGGGHLELKAIEHARALLRHAGDLSVALPTTLHFPLGPALGQCCGGAVSLRFDPLMAEHLAAWPGTTPRFYLQLYGAGHVGRAIARLLATLPISVDWIDERDEEFPPSLIDGTWPRHIRRVAVDAVEAEVRQAPPGAFYLVLTHQHDLDLCITEAILRRADFGFLGLIGSKTKRERFIHRFEERGISPHAIARMTCPIGVAGITGKEPEVIAVSAVAQLLASA